MKFQKTPEEMWVTAVQVATVWTDPSSAREIDKKGCENPTNMEEWTANLTYDQRLALCDENRIQTQLLYGEPVIIDELKGEWARIVIPSQPSEKDQRGYPGWVPIEQLKKVKKQTWSTNQMVAIDTHKSWLESANGDKLIELSYMTLLPLSNSAAERLEVHTPHGKKYVAKQDAAVFSAETGLPAGDGQSIIRSMEQFTGLAYFWGGMSAFGYDCSGLAYTAHKANGYLIGRDTHDQIAGGEEIAADSRKPGDLLFFACEEGKGKLHHVGIYCGNNRMLHAPQTGKGVEVISLKGTIYEKELFATRRYWNAERGKG